MLVLLLSLLFLLLLLLGWKSSPHSCRIQVEYTCSWRRSWFCWALCLWHVQNSNVNRSKALLFIDIRNWHFYTSQSLFEAFIRDSSHCSFAIISLACVSKCAWICNLYIYAEIILGIGLRRFYSKAICHMSDTFRNCIKDIIWDGHVGSRSEHTVHVHRYQGPVAIWVCLGTSSPCPLSQRSSLQTKFLRSATARWGAWWDVLQLPLHVVVFHISGKQ